MDAFKPPAQVEVLYTTKNSIYRKLGFECWDIVRDARNYHGPGPVIAHPPCGHWGRFNHVCQQPGKDCGPIAIDQVRKFGGVLEHPASSTLFNYCGCPKSAGMIDLWRGQVVDFNQGDYGHLAEKRTRLYIVGVPGIVRLQPGCRPAAIRPADMLSRKQRLATPLGVALLLLQIASQVEA